MQKFSKLAKARCYHTPKKNQKFRGNFVTVAEYSNSLSKTNNNETSRQQQRNIFHKQKISHI
jgi:hypothetical protein